MTEDTTISTETTKLQPTWANEPTVENLKLDLDNADQDQDTHNWNVERWLNNLMVTGAAKPKTIKGRSSIAPKLIRKQAEWRYPGLSEPFLSSPDIFNVLPTSSGDRSRALQNSQVLNNQFNHKIDRVAFIDEYTRDMIDIGTVICKVGWLTEEEERTTIIPVYQFTPATDPEQYQQVAQQYTQLAQLYTENKDLFYEYSNPGIEQAIQIFMTTGQIVIPEQVGEEPETKIVETVNQPTVEVCISANLIMDPSCNGDLDKANFVGEKFKSSLSDLKKDGRYTNLTKINASDVDPIANPDYEETKDVESFGFTDEARKQFVVHSYYGHWDIDNSGITKPIVAFWVGDVMIRLEENPFPDKKHPYISVPYMPMRKSLFGEPDGELLFENQQIIGAVTRGAVDLMGKAANGQTGFKNGLLDVTNQRKFDRGEHYKFNSNEDPRQGIHTHTYPEIPGSVFNMITMQTNDAESMSGVKAYSSGITGASLGESVSNGRSALDAASKREMSILRRAASGIVKIGHKFLSMNAEWLSEEEVVRITNEKFVTVRRDDLAGHYDLTLTISTAEEDNKQAEELAFMLQTDVNMDPDMRKMLLADMARLRKMPDMAKKIEEYQPQPDPKAEMKFELEMKLLEAQIAKEQSLVAKHHASAELNGMQETREISQSGLNTAKIATEQAKARDLGSTADGKDLDFIEQEAGVHQERDLQKIEHSAKVKPKEASKPKTKTK